MSGVRVVIDNFVATLRDIGVPYRIHQLFVINPSRGFGGIASLALSSFTAGTIAGLRHPSVSFIDMVPADLVYIPDIESPDGEFTGIAGAVIRRLMKRTAVRSSRILTNTENMAARISEKYGVDRQKIVTLELPVNPCFKPVPSSGSQKIMFLSTGRLTKRRRALIDLPSEIRKALPEQEIIFVRVAPPGDNELALEANCKRNNIEYSRRQDVDNESLAKLYSQATCYTYLSEMEGYSLTPKEALACGTPVLISHNATHDEIYGGRAGVVWYDGADSILKACKCGHSEEYSQWTRSWTWQKFVEYIIQTVGK